MFENKVPEPEVLADGATPVEFTFAGKRFRIHSVLSRWCEAGVGGTVLAMASTDPMIALAHSGE